MEGQAATVTANFISEVEELSYEFQLADIPLKSYAKMPAKIELAKFAGHEVPVTLQFVKIVPDPKFPKIFPPKVRLRVINHADKKVRRLDMKFEYLDPDGKKLKEWPIASYSGNQTFPRKGAVIVVAGNARAQFDTNAPFMPKETKTVAVTLKKVRFVDAEEWTPKAAEKPKPVKSGNRVSSPGILVGELDASSAHSGIQGLLIPLRFHLMVKRWLRRVMTRRSRYGTWIRAWLGQHLRGIRIRFCRLIFRQVEIRSRPEVETRP